MNWNQQRTNEAPDPVAGNPNIAKVYLTGVYVRLSVEDGGLGKESESLLHQETVFDTVSGTASRTHIDRKYTETTVRPGRSLIVLVFL